MGLQKYMQHTLFLGKKRVTPFISVLTLLSVFLVPKMSVVLFPGIMLVSQKYNLK